MTESNTRSVFRVSAELKKQIKDYAWRNKKTVTQILIDTIRKEIDNTSNKKTGDEK